jgi:hypothetical protein
MRKGMWGLAQLCAGAVLVVCASTASAQPSQQYLKAYQDGVDAARLGQWADARTHLEKAIKFDASLPGAWRWMAAVAEGEGNFEECLSHAITAYTKNKTSKLVAEVQEIHKECRKALGRDTFKGQFAGGGALAVQTNAEGATVRVNGLKYGVTPMDPRGLATGKVEVTVGHPKKGWLEQSVEVEIHEGFVIDVVMTLERDPDYKEDDGAIGGGTEEVEHGWLIVETTTPGATITLNDAAVVIDDKGRIRHDPGTHVVEVAAPGYVSWRRRVRVTKGQTKTISATLVAESTRQGYRKKGYYALVGAATFAAVGAVFGILERKSFEEAQDIRDIERSRPPTFPLEETGMFEPVRTRDDLNDAVDSAKTRGLISNISFGVAAVALGVSVYYFIKERPDGREGYAPPLAIAPVLPTDDTAGIGATVTYTTELEW